MGFTICILLVIAVLPHLLWLGLSDLFLTASRDKRSEALKYALLFSVMASCCCGLTWAISAVCRHATEIGFARYFWMS